MSSKSIRANTSGSNLKGGDITGTPLPNGKVGLDQFSHGTEHFQALLALIEGTMPEQNWNKISKTTNVDGSLSYLFEYNENQMFQVNVTSPYGDYVLTVTEFNGIITENGLYAFGKEDGTGEILLEG